MSTSLRTPTVVGGAVLVTLGDSFEETPTVPLAASTTFIRGQLVKAASFDGPFVPYLVAATPPAAGDIMAVILKDVTTGATAEPSPVGMDGSASQEYVVNASFAVAPTLSQLNAIKKSLLLTDIYLRPVNRSTAVVYP